VRTSLFIAKRFSADCLENKNCRLLKFFIFLLRARDFARAFCGGIFAMKILPQFASFIDTSAMYLLRGFKEKRLWIFYPYVFNILIFRAEEFLLQLTVRLFDVKHLLWKRLILY